MDLFKENQKIYVLKPDKTEQYISVIEKIEADNEITIALPLSRSSSLAVKVGEILTVRLPSESYCLEFTVPVKQIKIENVPVYILHYPDHIKRVQLRKHVRVSILLDVQYSELPGPGNEPYYKKALAIDISAGGMKLSVSEEVKEGVTLLIKFDLPVKNGVQNFELEAGVIRSSRVEAAKGPVYQLGLSFLKTTDFQKDTIFNYIFSKMSQLRRSGKV